jgi:hypothetical protein
MNDPFWKDRVWLCFVLGPLVWVAIVAPFLDWATVDGLRLASVIAACFVFNIGVVSACVHWIQGRR